MSTILLKFASPLQSWGTNSHFETRHTDLYPSKSALIGMVAAALGYRRGQDNDIEKLNQLDFAVRIDQKGPLLRDYHIAKKYKANGEFERSYVTNRYYLEDSIFLVAIGSEDEQMMLEIENALKNPYFQLYLGRKSLPVNADFFLEKNYKSVIENLKIYPWLARNWYKKNHSNSLEIYADKNLIETKFSSIRKDRVVSFSQKERKFTNRMEARMQITVEEKDSQTNHDIFKIV